MIQTVKKICFYVSSLEKGGAERVLTIISGNLASEFDITILTDTRGEVEYDLPTGTRRIVVTEQADFSKMGKWKKVFARRNILRKVIKKEQFDAIVIFMERSVLKMCIYTLGMKVPLIGAVRGDPNIIFHGNLKKRIANIWYRRLTRMVLQTQMQGEFFDAAIRKKEAIIPNPINENFCVEPFQGERTNRIVSVGNLATRKDQSTMIDAFAKIQAKYPDTTLTIYGEGHLRRELEEKIARYGLEDRILLPGTVENVLEHIMDARLFVMTSIHEGIPNALMEAMAIGLPCVVTDCPCGGPALLIRHNENGKIVKMKDIDAIAQAMDEMLANPKAAEEMGKKATSVKEDYALAKVTKMWSDVILGVCENE